MWACTVHRQRHAYRHSADIFNPTPYLIDLVLTSRWRLRILERNADRQHPGVFSLWDFPHCWLWILYLNVFSSGDLDCVLVWVHVIFHSVDFVLQRRRGTKSNVSTSLGLSRLSYFANWFWMESFTLSKPRPALVEKRLSRSICPALFLWAF